MIYKNKFSLEGTPEQQEIVKSSLDKIFFPWEKLTFPNQYAVIGWDNLNAVALAGPDIKKHEGAIHGYLEGRKYTLGIMYPHNGFMYIDNSLVKYPDVARSTVSAEIAHDVDYFLPLTEVQRKSIMELVHPLGADNHTWWEKIDYGNEYYTLVGEAFMQIFTTAYSDIDFGNTSDFSHSITKDQAAAVRQIIGIERTDGAAIQYETFPPSKIYHKLTHFTKREGKTITDTTGLKPCKICKP